MAPNIVALYATVIVLFTMLYFQMAAVPFLFVKLEDPVVARLLRGLFKNCFLLIAVANGIAAIAFAATGNPAFALGAVLIAAFAVAARQWFLRHMDTHWKASATGNRLATRGLRRLHWGGMATNLLQLVAVVGSLQFIA